MALKGTLKDFSLADIFQLIGIQKKTGILSLKSGQETATVSFNASSVIFGPVRAISAMQPTAASTGSTFSGTGNR